MAAWANVSLLAGWVATFLPRRSFGVLYGEFSGTSQRPWLLSAGPTRRTSLPFALAWEAVTDPKTVTSTVLARSWVCTWPGSPPTHRTFGASSSSLSWVMTERQTEPAPPAVGRETFSAAVL